VIQGRRTDAGCEYPAESEVVVVPEGGAWEARDIAVNPGRCLKLRESGVPATRSFPLGDQVVVESFGDTGFGAASASGSRSLQHIVMWRDLPGFLLHSDRTDITWTWSGGCVTSGSGQAYFTWLTLTGWSKVSSGSSGNRTCTRYFGTSNSHFRNTAVCGHQVDSRYFYVQAYGYSDGSAAAYRSTDTYNECLPLFMSYFVYG
jgi:hypothetical protein